MKAAEKDKEATAASNDLDAVAGNAEDDIGDLIAGIRETELLYGERSLLRVYGPLIAAICASPRRYRVSPAQRECWNKADIDQSPSLRLAATLALTKLMCVSGQYCEGHLLLLLKLLETSKDPSIRSNIVIALGDIAVSFGNLIDDVSITYLQKRTPAYRAELGKTVSRPFRLVWLGQEEYINGPHPPHPQWYDQSQRPAW